MSGKIDKSTKQQLDVINSRGKNLLVSASAGTGKTTVMIKRIVSLIEEKALSLSEIAVVTFTIFAAAEMKGRLLSALSEKSKEGGDYFKRQCELVENASISTIHSFCADILRNYFYVADIDPSFSIIDSVAQRAYADRVMTEVLTSWGKKEDKNYIKLYRVINSRRGDTSLKSELLRLYEFSRCIPHFEDWYKESRKNYLFDEQSGYLAFLNAQFTRETNEFARQTQELAYKAFDFGAKELAIYLSDFSSRLTVAPQASFTVKMANLAAEENIKSFTPSLKKYNASFKTDGDTFDAFVQECERLLKEARALRGEWKSFCDIDQLTKKAKDTLPLIDTLYELHSDFSQKFFAYKRERSLLDFSDLEHLTLKVLEDEGAAAEIRSKYKALFVDEYQDVNGVQEEIIQKLCCGQEGGAQLFCVGDIKQSIYGFRQCDPSIFLKRQNDYKRDNSGEVIELSQNFRSDNRILKYVNKLFSYCMSEDFGGADYANTPPLESDKALFCADNPVKVYCFDKNENKKEAKDFYDIESDAKVQGREEEDDDESDCQGEEAAAVVQCVKQLVGTQMDFEEKGGIVRRSVNYSDITILSRDMRRRALAIYRQLLANNIPVTAYFQDKYSGKEIADLVNFLRVLDNPYCDIYFCGAALSPLFNFTQEELAKIACAFSGSWQKRFTDCLAEGKGSYCQKVKEMLSSLEKYRSLSMFLTVDALLSLLIEEKEYELYVLSMPNGALRLNKLNALLEEIKDKSYAQSISKFLQYFEGREGGEQGAGEEQREGVFLTTIHKSKGLEFPIVISAGLGAKFMPNKNKVHFNKDLGIAIDFFDFENMEREESLSVTAQKIANRKKQREEELRLLYVLATRAKNSLTLIVPREELKTRRPHRALSIAAWITMTDLNILPLELKKEREYAPPLPPQDADEEKLRENLVFEYPYAKEQKTPLKVTASGLREEVLRGMGEKEQEQEEETLGEGEIEHLFNEPPQAAPLGTAYHKVFEKLPLLATQEKIKEKIAQLEKGGEISQENAQALDINKIEKCLSNPRLLSIAQGEIYHEIPFMVKLPYNSLIQGQSGEQTALQGVIDMLCVREKEVDIIDFKFTSSPHLIKQHYSLQMKAYREAVRQVFGKKVKSYIVSVINNEVIEID